MIPHVAAMTSLRDLSGSSGGIRDFVERMIKYDNDVPQGVSGASLLRKRPLNGHGIVSYPSGAHPCLLNPVSVR